MAVDRMVEVLIRVKPEGAGSSNGSGKDAFSCVVSYGAIAESAYFTSAVAGCKNSAKKEIQIIIASPKLATCKWMLEYTRSRKIPALRVDELLELLEMADRFKLRSCALAVSVRLSRMDVVTMEEVCCILKLTKARPGIALYPGTRLAMETATRRMLTLFRDMEKVAQREDLLKRFVQLPAVALVELLKQDELAVMSENTVFYLVTLWFLQNYGGCSAGETEYFTAVMEIGAQVRFPMMSENYLKKWVQETKWVADFLMPCEVWIQEALEYKLAKEDGIFAPEIYQAHRFRSRTGTSPSNELAWKVPIGIAKEKIFSGYMTQNWKFCGGYMWKIALEGRRKLGHDSGLGMHLYVDAPLRDMWAKGEQPMEVEGDFKLSARKFSGEKTPKSLGLAGTKWQIGSGWGFSNFFDEKYERVLRRGSPYVDNTGHLVVATCIEKLK